MKEFINLNEQEMTVTLRRIDVCNLLLALVEPEFSNPRPNKWGRLHDELKKQLDMFDSERGY